MSEVAKFWKSGYEGEPPPLDAGVEEVAAWADGLWQRQAEQMAALAAHKASLVPLPGGKAS